MGEVLIVVKDRVTQVPRRDPRVEEALSAVVCGFERFDQTEVQHSIIEKRKRVAHLNEEKSERTRAYREDRRPSEREPRHLAIATIELSNVSARRAAA